MTAFHLNLENDPTPIPYSIRRSRRTKRVRIVVKGAQVEIVAPHWHGEKALHKFLWEHRVWVYNKWREGQMRQTRRRAWLPDKFEAGVEIFYMGRPWPLTVTTGTSRYTELRFQQGFHASIPQRFTDDPTGSSAAIARAFRSLLEKRLERTARRLLNIYAKQMNVDYKSLQIKTLTSRWGSCSHDGAIVLSRSLIHTPLAVIRYVIIHELCHRVHFDHSKAFWTLVAQHCPDFKDCKQWLKRYGDGMDL